MKRLSTILVIDDDKGILEVISIILKENGFKVKTIEEVTSKNDLIFKDVPDLILLDIWMKGLSGKVILKFLKQNPVTKQIPVVFMSALGNVDKLARESRADGFLAKPFNIEDLMQTVKKYI